MEEVLLLLQIPADVAREAAVYLRIFASLPSLPWGASRLLAMMLRVQACVRYHVLAQFATEAFTLTSVLLVSWFAPGAGISLVAVVQGCARVIPLAAFIWVLWKRGRDVATPWSYKRETLAKPSMASLVEVRPMRHYLGLAVPGTLGLTAEMLLFESLLPIVSVVGGVEGLNAHAIGISIAVVTFSCLVSPLSTAAEVFVARGIGEGNVDKAQAAGWIAFAGTTAQMGVAAVCAVVFRDSIANAFVGDDPEVAALTASIMPLLAAFEIADALQGTAQGVMRGAGKQGIILVVQAISCVVGFGSAVVFGYVLDGGVRGVWTGLLLGLVVDAFIMLAAMFRLDWVALVASARARNEESARGKPVPLQEDL